MKSEILDMPEKEIDPIKLTCCSYAFFSFSVPPPQIEETKIKAGLAREKSKAPAASAKAKSAKSVERKVAA